jgi:methyl-accepting chemotaxis protein
MQAQQDVAGAAGAYVRLRTLLLVAVPLILPIIYSTLFVPWRQEQALFAQARESSEVTTLIFAANAVAPIAFADATNIERLLRTAAASPEIKYVAGIGAGGEVLGNYGQAPATITPAPAEGIKTWEADDMIHVTAAVKKDNKILGSIQAGYGTRQLSAQVASFRFNAIALSVGILLLASALSFLFGRSFVRLFDQLRSSILETARKVDGVVNQLAAVTAEQTAAASEESSALNESDATASEVAQAARAAADRAASLIEGGSRAEEGAAKGLEAVGTATVAMKHVREQVSQSATAIGMLSEGASAINDIASTVALLAERSNLLALNAAIEAARAGAQGRGFSVVAQEMRSHADGSNRSAGQVKTIISQIQSAIGRAVADAQEGERRVGNAELLADQAAQRIRQFAEATREFALLGKEIAASASQQSVAIEQMVESIRHASQAGNLQLETTKQVEETTRQLRTLSRELLSVVAQRGDVLHVPLDGPEISPRPTNWKRS